MPVGYRDRQLYWDWIRNIARATKEDLALTALQMDVDDL
jgi:hypothetical protein